MTLGQKLRSARIDKGWNQPQLADAIGAPIASISRWETDTMVPRVDTLTKLAKALDVPMSYLLDNNAGFQQDILLKELRAIREILERLTKEARS